MKNPLLILSVLIILAVSILTNCQSSATKVENAKDNVKDAKNELSEAQSDLIKARQDSISDYQKFKQESVDRINAYEKSIAELKLKIANEKQEVKSVYQKNLDALEIKTTELKNKLVSYKEQGQDKWSAFKGEFNHDMDELGKALKDLTKNNI